jgi:type II secretory pathway pseudopilin PulG
VKNPTDIAILQEAMMRGFVHTQPAGDGQSRRLDERITKRRFYGRPYERAFTVLELLVVIAIIGFLIALLVKPVHSDSRGLHLRGCTGNLKTIAIALRNYQNRYGCLPPSCIYDDSGRPMHSWRVLILPFLEPEGKWHTQLYAEYDFNEPWDGPNNRKLLAQKPYDYFCVDDPGARQEGMETTSYVAVVGSKAAWQLNKSTTLKEPELQGQIGSTVLLVEMADSGIQWTEPKDLCLDDLQAARPHSALSIHGRHLHKYSPFYHDALSWQAVFADGHVQLLPFDGLAGVKLVNLLAVGGCNEESIHLLEKEYLRIHWRECSEVFGLVSVLLISITGISFSVYRAMRRKKRVANCTPGQI